MTAIEQYAIDRRHPDRSPRRRRRVDRLALRPPLRLRRVLRRAPRRRVPRALAASRPPPAVGRPAGPYRDGTLVLETEWDTPEGHGADRRLHARAGPEHRPGARRRGRERARADAHGVHRPLRLRQHRSVGALARRAPSASSRDRPRCCLTTPVRVEGHDYRHTAEFTVEAGRARAVRARLVPVVRGPAAARRRVRGHRSHDRVLAGVERAIDLRRRLARCRAALAHHAEGAHLRADRRHRGRADHVAARVDRRRAQLGLPLLLAARRDVHALLADDRRLHRGGVRVPRLAAPRRGRRSRAPADHVRTCRRAAPQRVRGRLAAGLRGLDAGAGRQRRPPASSSSTCTAR